MSFLIQELSSKGVTFSRDEICFLHILREPKAGGKGDAPHRTVQASPWRGLRTVRDCFQPVSRNLQKL